LKILKRILLTIFFISVIPILVSFIFWYSKSKIEINIYILDKTVRDFTFSNHKSLFWILNNCRITKSNGNSYNYNQDYFGFFPIYPLENHQYEIKRISLEQIDSISDAYDALYYADTYGVYFSEWYNGFRSVKENSFIDGGLNQNDFLFLKAMNDKNKLIMLEYNTLNAPTSDLIRDKTEKLLGIHLTGWYGKYINNLDSSNNQDLPRSIINKYFIQHNREWPFKGSGIVLTNNFKVIVLQKGVQLISEEPYINSNYTLQDKYHIPENTVFLNWFEVINAADTNDIMANYSLNLTVNGDSILHANGIPSSFPAIVSYQRYKKNMFYFAGDFANNSVNMYYSRLEYSQKLLDIFRSDDRNVFFQNFYYPLINNILTKYLNSKKNKKEQ